MRSQRPISVARAIAGLLPSQGQYNSRTDPPIASGSWTEGKGACPVAHVEKRGPGRWRARYRDPYNRERSRTFARRVDAERWLTSVEHARLSGAYIDPALSRVTFGRWAEEWLATPGKRPSGWVRDESILRNHLLPTLDTRGLGTIKPADIQALVNEWTTKSAPRTVRRQYDVVRAILNAAVRR